MRTLLDVTQPKLAHVTKFHMDQEQLDSAHQGLSFIFWLSSYPFGLILRLWAVTRMAASSPITNSSQVQIQKKELLLLSQQSQQPQVIFNWLWVSVPRRLWLSDWPDHRQQNITCIIKWFGIHWAIHWYSWRSSQAWFLWVCLSLWLYIIPGT